MDTQTFLLEVALIANATVALYANKHSRGWLRFVAFLLLAICMILAVGIAVAAAFSYMF